GLVTEVRDPSTFKWGGLHFLRGSFDRPSDAYDRITGARVLPGLGRFEPGPWASRVAWLGEEGVANLLTPNQASVETDTTGFFGYNGSISRVATQAWHGSASLKMLHDNPTYVTPRAYADYYTAVLSTYGGSLYVKGEGATIGRAFVLYLYEWSGSAYVSSSSTVVLTAGWQRIVTTRSMQYMLKGPDMASPGFRMEWGWTASGVNSNEVVYVDGLQIQQNPYATSWQLPGSARSPEPLSIPIGGGVLPLSGFTWEQEMYFGPLSQRQVFGQYPAAFHIPRADGGIGIWLVHQDSLASWILQTRNDADVPVNSPGVADLTEGFHRVGVTIAPLLAQVFVDNVLKASTSNPPLPSALYPLAYVGCRFPGVGHANTLHADARLSKVVRSTFDLLTAPLPVDQYTTAKLDLNSSFVNTALIQPGWKWGRGEYKRTA
ncbi:MAG TPA: hypothetical protein VGL40_06945, partial [Bacillota bacterium]